MPVPTRSDDVAIVRMELLYPFPSLDLQPLLADYGDDVEFVWVQEEPRNAGSWYFLNANLTACIGDRLPLEPPREQPERREASPPREEPDWLPQPYDPQRESEPMREVLGPEFCAVYESVKRNEYKEFLQVISPWEREHLLLNV